jgi:GNAT superfamily N-acetyltransferase
MDAAVFIRRGTPHDVPAVMRLVKELAEFERLPDEVTLTLEELLNDGFGPERVYTVNVAVLNEEVIGIALFYIGYSTWKGKMLYLEDLIVTEKYRCGGIGKQLFETGIAYAKEINANIYKWQVLKWNEAALSFYSKYNAGMDGEWFNGSLSKSQLQSIDTSAIKIEK